MIDQMFRGPDAYPSHQGKSKDGVTQDAFRGAHFCGIQTQPSFDVGEKLFDGPAPGKTLNHENRFQREVGRRQVSGFAFAQAVPDDDDLKLDSGLRPPGDEGFVIETDELAVNFDANLFPAAAGSSDGRKAGKTASVFGLATPLFGFPFGQRGSQDGIETQAAGQGNLHCDQGFENRLIVVSPVGNERNLEGNPGLDFLESLDSDLEPSTKLLLGAMFLGAVKRDPKRQSDGHSKQLDDYGQNHPVVSPDVAGPGPAGVIPERAGTINVFAPFGRERIVYGNQELFELKGLDDQNQKCFEKGFGPELEMREEAVKAGFVTFESCSVTEAADMPLTGLNQPGNRGRTQIGPAPFGKSQTKVEDYFRKFRCSSVVDHGPFSCLCEFVCQQIASENGPFFLNSLSSVNL